MLNTYKTGAKIANIHGNISNVPLTDQRQKNRIINALMLRIIKFFLNFASPKMPNPTEYGRNKNIKLWNYNSKLNRI